MNSDSRTAEQKKQLCVQRTFLDQKLVKTCTSSHLIGRPDSKTESSLKSNRCHLVPQRYSREDEVARVTSLKLHAGSAALENCDEVCSLN